MIILFSEMVSLFELQEKIIAKKIPGFGKAEWNIHLKPLTLRPSQRVRTMRLYEGSFYKEEKHELILKIAEIKEASQEITDYLKSLKPVPGGD